MTVPATAVGQLFDTDGNSPTGDIWQEGLLGQSAVSPADLASIANRLASARHGESASSTTAPPVVDGPPTLAPGQSTTVLATIKPSGSVGSKVHRQLYIDTFNSFSGNGDELIDLPHAYTVG